MGKQWAYRIMKVLLIFACIALFFWIMGNIGQKFQDSHWVTVAKSTETLTELALPGIAVCLSQPYKDPDLDPLYSSGTKFISKKVKKIFNKLHFIKKRLTSMFTNHLKSLLRLDLIGPWIHMELVVLKKVVVSP